MDLIAQLRSTRDELVARMYTLRNRLTQEGRSNLTHAEQQEWDALSREREALDARIEEVEGGARREGIVEANARRAARGVDAYRLNGHPRTYNPDQERRGISFLRDLASQRRDPGATERLERHQREALDEYGSEFRDAGTGAFAGLTVPQYLTDMVAPARRAGRPLADICNQHDLPDDGMVVNISRITTGATTAIQATENAAVSETDIDDTLLAVNVRTIAGMQDVSRQAIDRSTGVEATVVQDLARSYNTVLDNQILNADGTAGTHLGIRSTVGIVAVTYTDASPTAAELMPKLADLAQQIQMAVFLGVSHFVMSPRRWWWLAKEVGTSFPFLQLSGSPDRGGEVLGTGTYEKGPAGILSTIPVILDANIPTNLGGGTEDIIIGVTADELHLWEDPNAPLFIRTDEAASNQLSVRFVLYGYTAFTAGRYPGAHGTIGGTGVAAPVF